MDIIDLLAPYRSKPNTRSEAKKVPGSASSTSTTRLFQFSARSGTTVGTTTTTVTRNLFPSRNTPATGSKIAVAIQFQAKSTAGQKLVAGTRPGPSQPTGNDRLKFSGLHKKPNLKFSRDASSQSTNRRLNFQENIKEKRTAVMNTKRGISESLIPKSASQQQKSSTAINASEAAKLSQMEKLLRWKKEKAEMLKMQKDNKKPPMTAGLPPRKPDGIVVLNKNPVVTKTLKPRNTASGYLLKGNSGGGSTATVTNQTDVTPPATQPAADNGRAVSNPNEHQSLPPVPVPEELLDLFAPSIVEQNENENVPPKSTPIPVPNVNSPAFKKIMGNVARSPIVKMGGGGGLTRSPAIKKLGGGQSPATKMSKKPKGMKVDSVYRDFQNKFMTEATLLSDYMEKWTKIVEEDSESESIPDEIMCDIESSIGQARLLYDSKLPQFADLLYSYLGRTVNTHPILPCDLEGWWDVANISIEKVKGRFAKLEKLSRNRWQPGDRVPLKAL